MSEPRDGGQFYEVHGSNLIAATLVQIQRRAAREGRGEQVLAAFREVARRLQREPNAFGEPLYRLPGLQMLLRSGIVRPLVVHFGVCEDRPLVFIKGIMLLPE